MRLPRVFFWTMPVPAHPVSPAVRGFHCLLQAIHHKSVLPPALALVALDAVDIVEHLVAPWVLALVLAGFSGLIRGRCRDRSLLAYVHRFGLRYVYGHVSVVARPL